MPKTCVLPVIERMEEDKLLGPASTLTDLTIPWECVKLATWLTTTKEETRPKRKKKSRPKTLPRDLSTQSQQSPLPTSTPKLVKSLRE